MVISTFGFFFPEPPTFFCAVRLLLPPPRLENAVASFGFFADLRFLAPLWLDVVTLGEALGFDSKDRGDAGRFRFPWAFAPLLVQF